MKIIRVTYCALATLLSVASCSKEATEPDVIEWADGEIYFRTSLSDVASSRAQDMTLDRLESFQVTCFNTEADNTSPYFENATFARRKNSGLSTYETPAGDESYGWPTNSGVMRFFAFSPSPEMMATGNSALDGTDRRAYFQLINSTAKSKTSYSVGYRLSNIRINPDISKQFDFVTAEASGSRYKDFMGGVDLAFSHRLSQVELNAWGANEDYDFDIVGVRIGNPVVEGTFVFADDANPENAAKWELPMKAVKDRIDYKYQEGDTIYRIKRDSLHNTDKAAASIMGKGGCAMVIPTKNKRWEAPEDPKTVDLPYTTDKMYFSILMRVTDRKSGKTIYPYSRNRNGMTVITYAVDNSGKITARLYAGETAGTYFTDPELKKEFTIPEGEKLEIMEFGWAAVPVDADWIAGKKYVYTLNYSEGIGMHDPADPEPGKIIQAISSPVQVEVKVTDWIEGTGSNVTVPRK